MMADIAPQQQLLEVFSHPCSYKRNSTTINTTMTNGHQTRVRTITKKHFEKFNYFIFCFVKTNELGKKADQILGHAPAVVDYRRQQSIDLVNQHPQRLNIP